MCYVVGYPGVSLLNAAGEQVGQPATRTGGNGTVIDLRTGSSASATIMTQGQTMPTQPGCVTGVAIRVFAPGQRDALTVHQAITYCGSAFQIAPLQTAK